MKIKFSRWKTNIGIVVALCALVLGYNYFTATDSAGDAAKATVDQQVATNPKSIAWIDLLPEGEPMVLPHDAATDFPDVKASPFSELLGGKPSTGGFETGGSETGGMGNSEIPFTPLPASGREDLANQFVKLAGYMTPLNVEQGKTRTFLLVPYVGACIHVPAPPANQIVLVESKEPIEVRKMWEPFEAVGTLHVETHSTKLADVSYTMDLNRIEPYVEKPAG